MSELATIPTNANGRMLQTRAMPPLDILGDAEAFDHFQRVAKMYASSSMIPEFMRGKVADVMIALAMARKLNEEPLIVMQSMTSVNGKAGWYATYMIGRANQSGKFKGGIKWRKTGAGESLSLTAFAKLTDTGEEISAEASMKMAIAEGWIRNPKYKSMPELMLSYRSATMLVRLYAPEVMFGRIAEEIEVDIGSPQDFDAPTGQLTDIIDEPETVPASEGDDVVSVESNQDIDAGQDHPSEPIEETKPREFANFEQFQIAVTEYGESRDANPDTIKALLNWAKLSTDANKVGKKALDARLSIFNDIVAGKAVNGVTF